VCGYGETPDLATQTARLQQSKQEQEAKAVKSNTQKPSEKDSIYYTIEQFPQPVKRYDTVAPFVDNGATNDSITVKNQKATLRALVMSGSCVGIAKVMRAKYGNVAFSAENLVSTRTRDMRIARNITEESMCYNSMLHLAKLSEEDIARMVVTLYSLTNGNVEIEHSASDVSNVKYRLGYIIKPSPLPVLRKGWSGADATEDSYLLFEISKSFATASNGFWTDFKLQLAIDFVSGNDIHSLLHSPFADVLYNDAVSQLKGYEPAAKVQKAGIYAE